jgi:hypothetical protein
VRKNDRFFCGAEKRPIFLQCGETTDFFYSAEKPVSRVTTQVRFNRPVAMNRFVSYMSLPLGNLDPRGEL